MNSFAADASWGAGFRLVIAGLLLLSGSGSQAGSSTVLGQSDAMRCYLESRTSWSADGERYCEAAIRGGDLNRRDLAATLSNRGIIRSQNGNYAGAVEDHTAALELVADLAEARLNRGNVYYRLRQYDRALEDFEEAGRQKQELLGLSRLNAGMTLLRMQEPARAIQLLEQALLVESDSLRVESESLLGLAREMLEASTYVQ